MNAIKFFMHRPLLIISFVLLVMVFGIYSITKLPIQFLPKIASDCIQIQTIYPGANNELIETRVTKIIRDNLTGLDIDYMTSNTTAELSTIKVYLKKNTSQSEIFAAIEQKVNAIQDKLPTNINPPVISIIKLDDRPMLILGFTGKDFTRIGMAEILRHDFINQLSAIQGVAHADVWSDDAAIQIYLQPTQLANYRLSPKEIVDAIGKQNVNLPLGHSRGHLYNYDLSINSAITKLSDFNLIPLFKFSVGPTVRLQDVASIRFGPSSDDYKVYYDGKSAVMVGISFSSQENPLTIAERIQQHLPTLMKNLPANLAMTVILDRTSFIKQAMIEVIKTLLFAVAIVILVMLFFLRTLSAALVAAMTIPISLLTMIIVMKAMHLSINTISLLAMVIAVSLVVDDAIIVIENISRHRQTLPLQNAIYKAMEELALPVIAMSLTLVCVYTPLLLEHGLAASLFKEFGITLAGCVAVSGFIALFITPYLSLRFLQLATVPHFYQSAECWLGSVHNFIHNHRNKALFIWGLMLLSILLILYMMPKEILPHEKQGFKLVVGETPPNANREYIDMQATKADKIYQHFPGILHRATIISPEEGYVSYLISTNQSFSINSLQSQLGNLPGIDMHILDPSLIGKTSAPIEMVLTGPVSYRLLYKLSKEIEEQARESHQFAFIYDDLNYTKSHGNLAIDHVEAARMGVSIEKITNTLSFLLSQKTIQTTTLNGYAYPVIIKLAAEDKENPEDLLKIDILKDNHQHIPLSAFVRVDYDVVPAVLNTFQRMNSVTLFANPSTHESFSNAFITLSDIAHRLIPPSIHVDFAGNARQYNQLKWQSLTTFFLAGFALFLLLCVQFNSYQDALIILCGSIPFAIFAALFALYINGATFNIYSQLGLLTLSGLIAKHGILIVRYANQLKASGNLDLYSCASQAALIRARPVIMTTVAVVAGCLPLLLSDGAGSASRHALGIVLCVGMTIGSLLTLFFLPTIYVFLTKPNQT